MRYEPNEKIYFAIESIKQQFEELGHEISELGHNESYSEVLFQLNEISTKAYQNCTDRDKEQDKLNLIR